ncbi:GDSL-type esterase/lipase family protein [Eubacteriales bacterium OttesenSCG-928-M02]|nr:GDSL-type esterase/lipase family protein [Eubacteriales bacterium OttesenSCG-928-M02]
MRLTPKTVLYTLMALGILLMAVGSILGAMGGEEPVAPSVTDTGTVPEETPDSTPVEVTAEAKEAFYANVAFLGDSVSLKLRNYAADKGRIAEAKFLVAGSFGVSHGAKGTLNISYQGQELRPEDAIQLSGAQRVFIMLGINDVALYGVDKTMENWSTLLGNIREKNPTVEVYIQSIPPIAKGGEKNGLTNALVNKYNERLQLFCAEEGLMFVDTHKVLADEEGYLKKEYCSDNFIHLTDAGCEAWVEALYETASQVLRGIK